jgi:hypothetical protein
VRAATWARAAAEDVAGDRDGVVAAAAAVVVPTAAVVPAAAVTAAAVVPGAVVAAVLAENGVHPVRASTRRAIPLRVRRIHPE